MSEMIERVTAAIELQTGNHAVNWTDTARAAIEAMRITDEDVMAHPWLSSDDQDAVNAYLDEALGRQPTVDR